MATKHHNTVNWSALASVLFALIVSSVPFAAFVALSTQGVAP